MKPRVIIHNAISVDGRIDGFEVDLGLYYGLVSIWNEDATLIGSETILKAGDTIPDETEKDLQPRKITPNDSRPLLVIADSHGRIKAWHYLLSQPYWRDGVSLCSKITPAGHLDYLKARGIHCIVTGGEKVDLSKALEELNGRFGVKTVRVDSGGTLNGSLLRDGLVDEISLLIHPCVIGDPARKSLFHPDLLKSIPMTLLSAEQKPGGVLWVRYAVKS